MRVRLMIADDIMRLLPTLSLFLCWLNMSACSGAYPNQLKAEALPGTQTWLLRCLLAHDNRVPVIWQLGPGVRPRFNEPRGEAALLVDVVDLTPSRLHIACAVFSGGVGRSSVRLQATSSLAPLVVTHAYLAAGRLTLEGSGFGKRDESSALFLDDEQRLVAVDLHCPQASFDDAKIVGCLPLKPGATRAGRLTTGGRLAHFLVATAPTRGAR